MYINILICIKNVEFESSCLLQEVYKLRAQTHLGGLHASRLPLAGQLVLQVSDLGLQQLDDLLIVLLSAAGVPLPHLGLGHLETTLQTDVLLHGQTRFLWRRAGYVAL